MAHIRGMRSCLTSWKSFRLPQSPAVGGSVIVLLLSLLAVAVPQPARASHGAQPSVFHESVGSLPGGLTVGNTQLQMHIPVGDSYVRARGHLSWGGGPCSTPRTAGQLWLNARWFDQNYSVV